MDGEDQVHDPTDVTGLSTSRMNLQRQGRVQPLCLSQLTTEHDTSLALYRGLSSVSSRRPQPLRRRSALDSQRKIIAFSEEPAPTCRRQASNLKSPDSKAWRLLEKHGALHDLIVEINMLLETNSFQTFITKHAL